MSFVNEKRLFSKIGKNLDNEKTEHPEPVLRKVISELMMLCYPLYMDPTIL